MADFEVEVTLRYITPDNYKGTIIKIRGKHERPREHQKTTGEGTIMGERKKKNGGGGR